MVAEVSQWPDNPQYSDVIAEVWTDYLFGQPYVDYTVTSDGQGNAEITERTRYLAGRGVHAQQTIEGGTVAATVNLHGDLIRSTMLLTDESGTVASAVTMYAAFGEPVGGGTAASAVTMYAAFGEPVTWDAQAQTWRVGFPDSGGVSAGTRYGYAGGWGYEGGPFGDDMGPAAPGSIMLYGPNPDLPPLTLLHVGERWYQPGTGRFVQRDPIGISGGWNVYAYCLSRPLGLVDPLGLMRVPEDPPFDVGTFVTTTLTGANIGAGWGGVGAVPGAIIGATTYVSTWAILKMCVGLWDIAENIGHGIEQEDQNRRLRERRPDVFPPPPPSDPPDIPCGPPFC